MLPLCRIHQASYLCQISRDRKWKIEICCSLFKKLIFDINDNTLNAKLEALIKTTPKLSDQYSVLEKVILQGLFAEIKSPEAVLSLIKHHDVSISSEDVILTAALSWVGKNSTNRVHYLHEILNHVKFSLIVKVILKY